jgi:cytochrome c553
VFARDGFACRYCGVRAGQDGVQLHVDHVVSVADGGDNSIDNLLAACQRCNGGKGARSLATLPGPDDVAKRMEDRARSLKKQAEAMQSALENEQAMRQLAANLKADAYAIPDGEIVDMQKGEITLILHMSNEFGAETVLEWYRIAAAKVPVRKAIKYVCGIARNVRSTSGGDDA